MATFAERLAFILSLDADGAIRGFHDVGRAADRELGRVENRLDQVANRSLRMGTGLLGVAAVGGAALFKLSGDAADLGESISKAGVMFDEAADQAEGFADGAASIGLSKRAALDALSTFKLFADQAGYSNQRGLEFSETLVQLASDAASFHNAAPEEVVTALGAALRNEFEPARRFGVILDVARIKARALSDGLSSQGQALDDNARITATYRELLDQLAVVNGDFARTADGAANSTRIMEANLENLRASIGGAVTPVVAEGAQVISDLAADIVGFNEATGGAIGNLALYATGASAAVGATLVLAGGLLKLSSAVKTASTSLIAAHPIITGLSAAVTIAAAAYIQFNREQREAADRAAALNPLLETSGDRFAELAEEILANEEIWKKSLDAMDAAGLTFSDVIPIIENGADVFGVLRDNVGSSEKELRRIVDVSKDVDPAAAALAERLLDLYYSGGLSVDQFRNLTDSLDESADSFDDSTRNERENLRQKILGALATEQITQAVADENLERVNQAMNLREVAAASQAWESTQARSLEAEAKAAEQHVVTSDRLDRLAAATRSAQAAEEARTAAIRDGVTATLEAASAELGYEGAVDRTQDAVKRLEEAKAEAEKKNTPENIEAVDDATRDLNRAILEQLAAYERLNEEATPDDLITVLEGIGDTIGEHSVVRARIQKLKDELAAVDGTDVKPKVEVDFGSANDDLDRLERRLARLGSTRVHVPLVITRIEQELD